MRRPKRGKRTMEANERRKAFLDNLASASHLWEGSAFLQAWNDACASNTGGTVLIPRGSYVLGAVEFKGLCKGLIHFIIKGTLEASDNPANMFLDNWITLVMLISCCETTGTRTVRKDRGIVSETTGMRTVRKDIEGRPKCGGRREEEERWKQMKEGKHFSWNDACASNTGGTVLIPRGSYVLGAVEFKGLCKGLIHFIIKGTLEASDNPANMFLDNWITLVMLISCTHDVEIWNVQCGPGHGFSIGSLGKYNKEEPAQSNVQIRNVTFIEVCGTSSSQFAVKLQCNKNVPCQDIKLSNINLAYLGPDGPVASSCVNVEGKSYGFQRPPGCL
nr:glycoside hydrolase, family 28 [Tanacetum cinerariifolium]